MTATRQMDTPWGRSDSCTELAPGIFHVTTPSHGGYFLTPDRNAQVPMVWRRASFNGQAVKGWYEEDCDWALVALTFNAAYPAIWSAQAVEDARSTFKAFHDRKIAS